MPDQTPTWPRPWLAVHERLGVAPPPFDDRPAGALAEYHADIRPDAVALAMGQHTLSYAQLDAAASALAGALAAHGIGAGDVVGIHLPNVPQYPIAIVAVAKLGAVISGVSPLLAPPELAHQLTDSSAKAIVTLDALAPALTAMPSAPPGLRVAVVTKPADAFAPAGFDPAPIANAETLSWAALMAEDGPPRGQVPTTPDQTAALQYTGGTTGRPKGAMLSIRTLMNNPRAFNAADTFDEGAEVVATAFPLFHIAGLSVFIGSLIAGAVFHCIPDPRDTDACCALLAAYPPTRMSNVPALYELLLANPAFAKADYSRLRIAVSGAAPLPRTTADKLEAVFGPNKLGDAFGMTETGPCYLFHPPAVRRAGTVGVPMPGVDVRIVDTETGADVPLGEPGEIACAGPQVMKGYLNLPDESAIALRDHGGKRWMHSGDVGSMDPDGFITLHDRAKDMLIVGGFKVFSVEVEDHLAAHPGIDACAVVGTPDEDRPGNDCVHLFVVPKPTGRADEEGLKRTLTEHIRETMAPYKVPRAIHLIDALPLTPVGKIDKKALRATLLAGNGAG